ncbi:deoxyribonuclease IV [Bifidobacterium sp. 82T24]|uniref:deoxyribonuclease IV n=1 Tax=Bifidobacterium pluvialisilvae TaxID=2834436 RepID=UPI001C565D5C|nr:deoxyribonuclease IV [Bifidobacterium pluvialisilvae]MBW3088542.1 deoxyribonuclease IV [Bifidobacterium pluvialisilvae]
MGKLFIGSHLSTAGGWNKLLERSHDEDGTAFAFFPRSPYGKRSKALTPEGAAAFGERLVAEHYGPLVVHAPYVYNFAGKDASKRAFAIDALAEDIRLLAHIAAAGQRTYINIHPGSHVGQGSETGCRLIAEGINRVFDELDDDAVTGAGASDGDGASGAAVVPSGDESDSGVMILLETMAGKGTECGRSFEELASIIDGVGNKAAVGVTFDTCHVYDAGYDIVNDLDGVLRQFDDIVGLGRLKAIHANDSQFGFASHKDRHANIGEGKLGIEFFRRLVNDPRMAKLPMILETKELTETTHREEIALLRSLCAR